MSLDFKSLEVWLARPGPAWEVLAAVDVKALTSTQLSEWLSQSLELPTAAHSVLQNRKVVRTGRCCSCSTLASILSMCSELMSPTRVARYADFLHWSASGKEFTRTIRYSGGSCEKGLVLGGPWLCCRRCLRL